MKYELTPELIAQLCTYMRLVELFENNPDAVNSNAEFKERSVQFTATMKNIWDALTEEQQNIILEEYKKQSKVIENEQSSKKKKKK